MRRVTTQEVANTAKAVHGERKKILLPVPIQLDCNFMMNIEGSGKQTKHKERQKKRATKESDKKKKVTRKRK